MIESLTTDHKPCIPEERMRIEKCSGIIDTFKEEDGSDIGPSWVWAPGNDMPGLAMSRSIGDGLAHSVGVIPDPEVKEFWLTQEDKFVVLASDGVWEFMTNFDVASLVANFYYKN